MTPSFSENIKNSIENIISLYIKQISIKYNLNETELYKVWNNSPSSVDISLEDSLVSPLSPSRLNMKNNLEKLSKTDIKELCKSKKLKVTGTKNELIELLINAENKSCSIPEPVKKTNSPPQKKVSPKTLSQPIIKKLVDKIPSIHVKRNNFNNYEHPDTKFVFNNKTHKVYGKQNDDGTVSDLTEDDIDLCNQYKFQYYIPENLDNITDLQNVNLDELNEDEVEDIEEDYEEELELEDEEEFDDDGDEYFEE
jgi:hypothetical protein